MQLGNSQVEASFADHRTYLYSGKEVDQQVHLGFDLAVTAGVPVAAANAGKVLHAAWLGIYGNCVIVDHGMGVASLYGHLSSIDVKVGDTVTKGQALGRSGMTGLAGGDHLHFTMLVERASGQSGRMVGSALDSGSGRAQAERIGGRIGRAPRRLARKVLLKVRLEAVFAHIHSEERSMRLRNIWQYTLGLASRRRLSRAAAAESEHVRESRRRRPPRRRGRRSTPRRPAT